METIIRFLRQPIWLFRILQDRWLLLLVENH